jgi:hypothetical protein
MANKITVRQARAAMAKHLSEDEGLFLTYEAAIAMYLHDNEWIRRQPMPRTDVLPSKRANTQHHDRNKAAEDLLNLLFSA